MRLATMAKRVERRATHRQTRLFGETCERFSGTSVDYKRKESGERYYGYRLPALND